MKKIVHALYVCLLVSNFSQAQTKSAGVAPKSKAAAKEVRGDNAESVAKLPVRRVVLYKNGIGYFEHLGRVHGSQTVHVDFTSAQLNDVLKSLTALDLSGGRITGVDYNSEAPLARRLATLREQETRLDGLRKKIQETEAQRDKENELLEKMIDALQIEATM